VTATTQPDAMNDAPPRAMRNRLWRDPLLGFLALTVVLFALDAAVPRDDGRTIVIDRATVAAMVERNAYLLGRPPTPVERAALIDAAVDHIVLAREATALGLYAGDPQIRGELFERLARRFAADVAEPTEAEIAAYYAARRDQFGGRTLDRVRGFIRTDLWLKRREARLAGVAAAARDRYAVVLTEAAP